MSDTCKNCPNPIDATFCSNCDATLCEECCIEDCMKKYKQRNKKEDKE